MAQVTVSATYGRSSYRGQQWGSWSYFNGTTYRGCLPVGRVSTSGNYYVMQLGFEVPNIPSAATKVSITLRREMFQGRADTLNYAISTTKDSSAYQSKNYTDQGMGSFTWTAVSTRPQTQTFQLSAQAVAALVPGKANFLYVWAGSAQSYTECDGGGSSYPLSNQKIIVEYADKSIISSTANWMAGDALLVNITRYVQSYTHTVIVSVGGIEVARKTNVATSVTFSDQSFQSAVFAALSKSASKAASIVVQTYSGSILIGSDTKSGTCTAPPSSTMTISQSSIDVGQTVTFVISPSRTYFTHTIQYSVSGNSGVIAEKTSEQTIDWTVPDEFLNYITTSGEAVVTIQLFTFYENNQVQSARTYTLTVYIPGSEPVFTNASVADTNETTIALTGSNQIFVSGFSILTATITVAQRAIAQNGAQMVQYKLSCGDKSAVAPYSDTADVNISISGMSASIATLSAIDSRGKSTTLTFQLNLVPYTPVVLARMSVSRQNGVESQTTLSFSGTIWIGNFGVETNSIQSVQYRYKEQSSTYWSNGSTDIVPVVSSGSITFSGEIIGDEDDGFSPLNAYDIEVTVNDLLSSSTLLSSISSGHPGLLLQRLNDGSYVVGINGIPDTALGGGVQVFGGIYLSGAGIDDFVVESVSQNTQDGLYRYQKWNSGKVELWGWRNPGKVELPNQVTGLRYSDTRTYALPGGLFTAIDYANVWITNSSRIVWAVSNGTPTAEQIRWWIVSTYTASVESTVRERFYVVGTWK